MKSKLALFLATLLFFNIILPTKVFAASVQDQSKPIFGLTADQVVEKYNQLTVQQKDQVLRSLGNTSIFANSLFGNIFNSTFGALDDAVKKLGDLFFQANGVVYKLGSSALAWVSRLIDKVFSNDLNDLNISQPVIDDLYKNTKDLNYKGSVFFVMPHKPNYFSATLSDFNYYFLPLPDLNYFYVLNYYHNNMSNIRGYSYVNGSLDMGIIVNLDDNSITLGGLIYDHNTGYVSYITDRYLLWGYSKAYSAGNDSYNSQPWYLSNAGYTDEGYKINFSGSYELALKQFLLDECCYINGYYLIQNNYASFVPLSQVAPIYVVTNNTYYNYIYNIPDQTPLNVTNIVSNTAIIYDPVENLIQYLPDNYNIEQNFSVVNNYYITSGSAITGQAIDVNIVSPGIIDVRVINPEDLTQQVTNNVSKDIINNTDVNFGDLNFSPSVTVGLNAAKDSIEGIVPVTGSSIVAQFVSGIPPDWLALGFVFLILFIAAGFGMSIIRH